MKHIQPFYIFEGLLKPRDLSGRKEQYQKALITRYAGFQQFTDNDKQSIIYKIRQSTSWRISSSHIDDYILQIFADSNSNSNNHVFAKLQFQIRKTEHSIFNVAMEGTINGQRGLTLLGYANPIKQARDKMNLSTEEVIDYIINIITDLHSKYIEHNSK